MPHQTELEWAKEICRAQGYHVFPVSRVHPLYCRHSLDPYTADLYKDGKHNFRENIWSHMTHEMVAAVVKQDLVIKQSRMMPDRNPMHFRWADPRGGILPQNAVEEHMGWPGVLLQMRMTVLEE